MFRNNNAHENPEPQDELAPDGLIDTSHERFAATKTVAWFLLCVTAGVGIGKASIDAGESVASYVRQCEQPSMADFGAVETLLNEAPKTSNEAGAADLAHELGLTTFTYGKDYKEVFDDQRPLYGEQDGRAVGRLPFWKYFQAARSMADRYGVTIDIPLSGEFVNGTSPVEPSKLETESAKKSMLAFIRTLGKQPVELVRYSGLKHVKLVTIPDPDAGFVYEDSDTYYIDPMKYNEANFAHEEFHMIDNQECSDPNDDSFASLGPVDTYTPGSGWAGLDYLRLLKYKYMLSEYLGDGRETSLRAAQITDTKPKVVTFENYGLTRIIEDKATFGEAILEPGMGGSYQTLETDKYPVVHEKFLWLLARMYHNQPAATTFLIKERNYRLP